jgi:hypothetical protein
MGMRGEIKIKMKMKVKSSTDHVGPQTERTCFDRTIGEETEGVM